jgi:hypothetical protein
MTILSKLTRKQLQKLQALQQQQVTAAHARIAFHGVREQGLDRFNTLTSTISYNQVNSEGRVASAHGRGFVEKTKGKERGSLVMFNTDKKDRPSVLRRIGEALGLKGRIGE